MYLASCLISAACHFGAAYADSYATMITARVFQGIFLCPPQAIGAQTVGEMFFQHEKVGLVALLLHAHDVLSRECRGLSLTHAHTQSSIQGQKLGVWTLMVTLGPPVAPFIFGFGA